MKISAVGRVWLIWVCLSGAAPLGLFAQKPVVQPSPAILRKPAAWRSDSIHHQAFILYSTAALPETAQPGKISVRHKGEGVFLVQATPYDLLQWLGGARGRVFWDEQATPVPDAGVINYDMTVNRISQLWQLMPALNGSGETVSIKEGRPDTVDIDLLGKYKASSLVSPVQDNHATIMTTLLTGSGNSSFRGKGVAWGAQYSSTDFKDVLPDTITYYKGSSIQIQNHSYGTGLQPYYGVNARAFDQSAVADSSLLHIISAGNAGVSANLDGPYAGVQGMANITGNFKQAKNALLVGAVSDDGSIPAYSSRGPLYDGRIAPHLVAFGDDGTSGAAALVSGSAVLLQQAYKNQYGKSAAHTLVKAVLINAARDLGEPGPDYHSGFGSHDAYAAMQTISEGRFLQGKVDRGSTFLYNLPVGANLRQLKLTLVWNDGAAEPGAAHALLNNLDLTLEHLQTGEVFRPWVLSGFPSADSLRSAARRGLDSLNNIEQVTIALPQAGNYLVRIHYRDGITENQDFSIAWLLEQPVMWAWEHPLAGDQLLGGERQWLRWRTSLGPQNGVLEISGNKGLSWDLLTNNADPSSGQYPFLLPDTMKQVRFRMRVGTNQFETADIMVSPSRSIQFGLVCDTTVLLYWNRIPDANGYIVYQLQGNTMARIGNTTDTVLRARKNGSAVYAMAGVKEGKEGIRGATADYNRQRVGCYINRFIAGPRGTDAAALALDLGSIYDVNRVEIIKTSEAGRLLLRQDKPNSLSFLADDLSLKKGLNVYQAVVRLNDGTVIRSGEQVVSYLGEKKHILFPNPAARGQQLQLLSDLTDDLQAVIYDMHGRQMSRFTIRENLQSLPAAALTPGVYVLRIFYPGGQDVYLRFVIR